MQTRNRLMVLLTLSGVAVAAVAILVGGSSVATAAGGSASDAEPAAVVARIGDYEITKSQLQQRLLQEVRPQREYYGVPDRSVTAESVLREMLAEKAMSMEGRALGYLRDETISDQLEQNRRRRLIQMLLTDYVRQQIPVVPAEIDAQLEAHPELTREQAERRVQAPKAGPVLEKFYAELLDKYEVEKVEENFAEAARIHQRLLTQPATPRGPNIYWIMNSQVRDELTEAERNLVLVKYEGGRLTLEDWFKALCQFAPPGRPKNLNTAAGVEALADRALQPFILAAEATARGCDQDEEFLRQMRQIEDVRLLGKVQAEKLGAITKPTEDEIKAYFEAHKELFGTPAAVKIEQIWCQDRQTAQQAREMLDDGASWETVRSAHSLVQNDQPHNTYAGAEGPFWHVLWQAEPNDVSGPIRGFYADGVKWRVVKVLAKTRGQLQPYSDAVKNRVESAIYTVRRQDILTEYGIELLEKHRYELYTDRIWDIDPLEVTEPKQSGN